MRNLISSDIITNKKKFKENPRVITKKEFELLKSHINDLGDLSGVVYCHKNDAYLSGNQRSEIFDGSKVEIVEKFEKPTKKGTIAYGFITYGGEKYSYREVYFPKSKFDMACMVANYDGGSFDWDVIANNYDELKLSEWGVKVWQSLDVKKPKIGRSIMMHFSPHDISRARELVDYFKTNDIYIGGEILDKLESINRKGE